MSRWRSASCQGHAATASRAPRNLPLSTLKTYQSFPIVYDRFKPCFFLISSRLAYRTPRNDFEQSIGILANGTPFRLDHTGVESEALDFKGER